jgi:lysozyme
MLDIGRQQILIEMAYQMGGRGLMKFKRFLAALKEGNFSLASDEMLDSSWARDHTPARAKRLAARMLEDPAPTELSDEDLWGT